MRPTEYFLPYKQTGEIATKLSVKKAASLMVLLKTYV